jgi:hypothetical protein
MKQLLLLLIMSSLFKDVTAQEVNTNKILVPPPEWTVQAHKEQLKLTLIVDSVRIGKKVDKLNYDHTWDINFESDYLQLKDDLYIKIFIARNQEYGKKFYSWKWDYLRKRGANYNSLGIGYYAPMDYNQPIPTNGNYGQGIGNEGESDYLMFYYRYKLE